MKVNRHHKPRQVLRFVYPNLWNNWEKQCHNKGEEKQPVGLWAINTIQWAAHHCEMHITAHQCFCYYIHCVRGTDMELLWMTCINAGVHYRHSPCLLGDSQYKIILYVWYAFWNVYNKRVIMTVCINCKLYIYIYIYTHKL